MLTILIVDDEKETVNNLNLLLSKKFNEGFTILKSSISRSAREILLTQVVDLLLTDIRMPGLSGFELAKIAKENNPQCKVVFLTGFQEFEYAYEAIKLGCDDFVLKINTNEEILTIIDKVIIEIKLLDEQRELGIQAERFKHYYKEELSTVENPVEFVKRYLWKHIDQEITLVALSEMVYLNPSYLSRIFKQITGITITEYLLEVRVQLSKEMLWDTDMKIQDIAQRIGLDSSAYFGKLFKKAVGCTPHEYRAQNYERTRKVDSYDNTKDKK